MRLVVMMLLMLAAPLTALAQADEPGAPGATEPGCVATGSEESTPDDGSAEPNDDDPEGLNTSTVEAPTAPPPPMGLPGGALLVAHVAGLPGVSAGQTIEPGPGGILEVPDGGCIRLVAADAAAVSLCGPARAELQTEPSGLLRFVVTSGRGVLYADSRTAAVEVAGRQLTVTGGTAAFHANADAPSAALVAGETATFDGTPLTAQTPGPEAAALLAASFCAPPRPQLVIHLGNPETLTETSARARAAEAEGGEGASAEGTATCVDSANTSTASDPNQGTDTGVDPDVRGDQPGRVRLRIRMPTR